MKNLFILFWLLSFSTYGQFIVRPVVLQNAFQIYYNQGTYIYGGKFGSSAFAPGLDLEYRFTKELDSLSSPAKLATNSCFAILFSAQYWNHKNVETGFNKNGDQLYSAYSTQFIAMPMLAKYYMQPGVLDEKMRIGGGLGVMGLYRLKTELHENATIVITDPSTNASIPHQFIEDTADLTSTSPALTLNFCLELSFEYSRFYFALRVYSSGQDQYAKGIESTWKIPEAQSIYIQTYKTYPKITYTGGGLLLGWRINGVRQL